MSRAFGRPAQRAMAAAALAFASWAGGPVSAAAGDLSKIDTIVVIYAENRSFDHLYGLFPGANGIANAKPENTIQRDHDGSVLPELKVWTSKGEPDPKFPVLPNAPFRIDAPPVSRSAGEVLLSPIHAYFHHIEQINGGRNDMFAAMSTVGGYVMGHFDGSQMKLWQWEGVHARRQLFHGGLRWILSKSSMAGLRVHTRAQGRARSDAGPPRCQRQAREEARLPLGTRRRRPDLFRRSRRTSLSGRLLGEHHTAAVSTFRNSTCCRRLARPCGSQG